MHQYKRRLFFFFLCYNKYRSDKMKLGIASDHRGYNLKEKIKEAIENIEIIDYGTIVKNHVIIQIMHLN